MHFIGVGDRVFFKDEEVNRTRSFNNNHEVISKRVLVNMHGVGGLSRCVTGLF